VASSGLAPTEGRGQAFFGRGRPSLVEPTARCERPWTRTLEKEEERGKKKDREKREISSGGR